MGLSLKDKELVVSQLSERLAGAQAVIFAEYLGTSATAAAALRRSARESGVYLKVLRNTLVRRAIKGTSFEVLSDRIFGPLVYAIGDDPVSVAKVLYDFSNVSQQTFVVKGGAVSGRYIDCDAVKVLATLPSREELLSRLMGTMQAPISQFARVMNEIPTKFVRALAAIRDLKESSLI
ncbi:MULTISPECIES: 50S ribosomal protein L10 [Candidatus Ichthyocystis]|uniref:Large ribosomal subunit protein uL10 n=1 Tax=Candidatus Ichthyocystis hellenicum TaxID=1561003 RepID=A0A0S4M382_9BURK|nr:MULTISPECIES: 50S ribosomal protein L10 [Ichthyocystis]CUT17330.1 50S ribosomal protein L10 [Candidatus Ichthyocystis hellenicum]